MEFFLYVNIFLCDLCGLPSFDGTGLWLMHNLGLFYLHSRRDHKFVLFVENIKKKISAVARFVSLARGSP